MELICQEVASREDHADFPEYVRRTRTICIYADDRPGIKSKDLVRVTVTANGTEKSGTFCVDAVGSKSGHLIASAKHLKELGLAAKMRANVTIRQATAAECVDWLQANADPERQALGFMLGEAIDASASAKQAALEANYSSQSAVQAAAHARDAAEQSRSNYKKALLSEQKAEIDRKKGYFYAFFAFILGAFLDVGMIEEKSGLNVPGWLIILLIVVALLGCCVAQRIRK